MALRNSSSRISPGGIAGPSQLGSLVIIFDADFVGMPLLPSERDTVLVIDPNAVAARLVTLQSFQTVARRYSEILQPCHHVERLELPLSRPPELTTSTNG
jgi:hypothetical protein